MNLAHLASFQAIHCRIRGPASSESAGHFLYARQVKTKLSLQKAAFCTQRMRTLQLISFPVSTLSTWSAQHNDCHNNVGRIEFGESTGKFGLKVMKEHTRMKEKWCNFIIWCLVGLYLCLNLYLSTRGCQYGWVSKQQRSRIVLWLSRCRGATTHDFLRAQPKIQKHMRPVGR